jgi:hypothetical protein
VPASRYGGAYLPRGNPPLPTTNPAPPGAQHAPRRRRLILILLTAVAAALSLAACTAAHGSTPTVVPTYSPASAAPVSPSPVATGRDSTTTYVSSFREEFPHLAQGKTDAQIISDGEADCSDMAASWTMTTPSMAQRYGLGDSAADQFTLHNIALLDMFTICPVR